MASEPNEKKLEKAVKKALKQNIPSEMADLRSILEKDKIKATNDNGIAFAMILKALKGDKSAAEWVRNAASEKTKENDARLKEPVVIISGDDEIEE